MPHRFTCVAFFSPRRTSRCLMCALLLQVWTPVQPVMRTPRMSWSQREGTGMLAGHDCNQAHPDSWSGFKPSYICRFSEGLLLCLWQALFETSLFSPGLYSSACSFSEMCEPLNLCLLIVKEGVLITSGIFNIPCCLIVFYS